MENWGCVTWTDAELFRTAADVRRADRARLGPAPRDGAHVVRRPRDDAVVGRPLAQRGVRLVGGLLVRRSNATEFTDGWASFLAGRQGARLPPGHEPGHPPDPRRRARRRAGDGQLRLDHLHEGRERPQAAGGLRRRGRVRRRAALVLPRQRLGQHPARRPDRRRGRGRRAATWPTGPGCGSTAPAPTPSPSSRPTTAARLRITAPDGEPRPHTLRIGSYRPGADGLELVATTEVETRGDSATLELPAADLHLVNDDDLTFAAARPDADSLQVMLDRAGSLPDPAEPGRRRHHRLGHAGQEGAARPARTSPASSACCGPSGRPAWSSRSWTARRWPPSCGAPRAEVADFRSAVADAALALTEVPDLRLPALHALAAGATTDGTSRSWRRPATTPTWPGGCWSAAPSSASTTPTRSAALRRPRPRPRGRHPRARPSAPRCPTPPPRTRCGARSSPTGRSTPARRSDASPRRSGGPARTRCCCRSPSATSTTWPTWARAACSSSAPWPARCSPGRATRRSWSARARSPRTGHPADVRTSC